MDTSSNDYHISFFKPTTPQAKANRNIVIWFVLVWAIAIFGFQILLRVLEKPTPEPAYLSFEKVWENVENGSASVTELQEFGQSTLSVLGKVAIDKDAKLALDNAVSWTVYQLTADSLKSELAMKVKNFENTKAEITNISEPAYIEAKIALGNEVSPILGLPNMDIRSKILPLELSAVNMENLSAETIENLPGTMETYLIHNQSALTDFKFLGFPFHYFYTAIFLLVLFVFLCWLYCVRIDSINTKLNIAE